MVTFSLKESQPINDMNPDISRNLENLCFSLPPSSVIQNLNEKLTLPFEPLTLKRVKGC